MRVLVAFESSGITRDAFALRGHDAWSCDLLPGEGRYRLRHYQQDVRQVLGYGWDLMIAHPTCAYMCASGLHWNHKRHGRHAMTLYWLAFVRELMAAPIPRIAIENPVGAIGSHIRKADQYIQPYEYGHDASKRTGLWLQNLPKLTPTQHIAPRLVGGLPRWGNQTDSGQNRLGPSEDRWRVRSQTYRGWASAMADQWGDL